jgi:hypothetical protein
MKYLTGQLLTLATIGLVGWATTAQAEDTLVVST